MFIETSAKAGYNVKQVHGLIIWQFCCVILNMFVYLQLFRRVAAALPGMEADKKPPEDSILFNTLIFRYIEFFYFFLEILYIAAFILFSFNGCMVHFMNGFYTLSKVLCFRTFILYIFLNLFVLVTEIDLNNAPVDTKPTEGGCAC